MTDFTNDIAHMTDTKRDSKTTGEYRFYFALILMCAVPFCTAIWAYRLIRHAKLPAQGPIRSAISEAHAITPRIFWA